MRSASGEQAGVASAFQGRAMTQQAIFYPLGGGMDLVTPAVSMPPGRAVASLNYEPVANGYRRLRGYERFDGHPSPSIPDYWKVPFQLGTSIGQPGPFVPGDTVYRFASIIRAHVIDVVTTSGDWTNGDASGYLVVVDLRRPQNWTDYGDLYRNGLSMFTLPAKANGPIELNPDFGEELNAQYRAAARDWLISQIQPVPGSGPVRGLWTFADAIYAVRDTADGTAAAMHRAYRSLASNGWLTFDLGWRIDFEGGGPAGLAKDDGIVGQVSGTFGFARRVVVESGSWAGGDAAGYILAWLAPGFQPGEIADKTSGYSTTIVSTGLLTITAAAPVSLPAGGQFTFVTHNFRGASNLTRLYGVSRVGPAFEFDPIDFVLDPIATGAVDDRPTQLAVHRQSLFLALPGGSLQFSQVGEPTLFDPALGAGEIGVGSEINALVSLPNALGILGEDSISILYGNDSSDYQLEVLTREAGAFEHSAQKIGQLVYMDNRGLRGLEASQAYGNFAMGTISRLVAPLLEDYRRDGVRPVASFVCRTADQYWLFFDNGTGLIVHMGSKEPQILPIDLGRAVTCAASVEVAGEERLFFGSGDGYVYELNKGTSFDGAPIEHYLRLPFNHFGSPQQRKRIHKIGIDLEATGTTTLSVSADLDYGAAPGIEPQQLVVTTGGGAIDSLGSNELYFASQIETRATAHLDGVASNISLKIGGLSADEEPHILTGVTFHVSPRGLQR